MQLSIISIVSLIAAVSAENALVALNEDIHSNLAEYLSFIAANTQLDVAPLLSLYQAASTYTDDSYTTLVDAAEMSSISEFVTQLPWYSTRLEAEIAGASTTASPAESSSAVSSTVSSSVASSVASASSKAVESSASSIISSVSSVASSSEAKSTLSTSSSSVSSISSSSSTSEAGAAVGAVIPGVGAALVLGAVALL